MTGTGLMLGQPVTLTLKPAPEDSGIVFRRVDMEDTPGSESLPRELGGHFTTMYQST